MKYENIYYWNVIKEIEKGETVYMIDKAMVGSTVAIREANDMPVENLVNILKRETKDNRYEFYKKIESEE